MTLQTVTPAAPDDPIATELAQVKAELAKLNKGIAKLNQQAKETYWKVCAQR